MFLVFLTSRPPYVSDTLFETMGIPAAAYISFLLEHVMVRIASERGKG